MGSHSIAETSRKSIPPAHRGHVVTATSYYCGYFDDMIHSPHKRQSIEHHQTARVKILTGLDLGQMELLYCTLREEKERGII